MYISVKDKESLLQLQIGLGSDSSAKSAKTPLHLWALGQCVVKCVCACINVCIYTWGNSNSHTYMLPSLKYASLFITFSINILYTVLLNKPFLFKNNTQHLISFRSRQKHTEVEKQIKKGPPQ